MIGVEQRAYADVGGRSHLRTLGCARQHLVGDWIVDAVVPARSVTNVQGEKRKVA